jgi:hypothetical protein
MVGWIQHHVRAASVAQAEAKPAPARRRTGDRGDAS